MKYDASLYGGRPASLVLADERTLMRLIPSFYQCMLFLAALFLCCLAGCAIQPYWHDGACVADDDKIRVHWEADIYKDCQNNAGWAGCTVRHCDTKSADIYLSTLATVDKQCMIYHEWQHAKGKDHADGATDCAPRS